MLRRLLCRSAFSVVSAVVVVSGVGCASVSGASATSAEAWDGDAGGAPAAPVARAPVDVAEASVSRSGFAVVGDAVSAFFAADDKEAPANATPTNSTAPPLPKTDATTDPSTEQKPQKSAEAAKRLVIYTGSMSLMVPVADVAAASFVDRVNGLGGYLQSRSGQTVTVRVPAEKFFSVLDELRKSGTVTDEQVNAQDVTKKVFDIELRLQTAEESRKRLVEILKAATKVEDILRIETEIRRLTDEIEAMKGELRNLADQVAFSTLTVAFYANAPSPRPYPERTQSRFGWINAIGVEQVLYNF